MAPECYTPLAEQSLIAEDRNRNRITILFGHSRPTT
jgi:hypothetical protein